MPGYTGYTLQKWVVEAGDLNLTFMDLKKEGVALFENFSGSVKIKIKKIDYTNYNVEQTKDGKTEMIPVNITDLRKIFSGFNAKIIKRLSLAYTEKEYSRDRKRFKEQIAERDRQLKEQGG